MTNTTKTHPASVQWLSLVCLMFAMGCGRASSQRSEPEAAIVPVKLGEVHVEDLELRHRASGTIRGRSTVILSSRTSGYVRQIHVQSGDRVTKGQLLASLEAPDVEASLRRARAGLDHSVATQSESENGLSAATANAALAKTARDRMASLFQSGSVSAQELDDAEARAKTATAQEEMARARLRGSSSRIEQARAEMGEVTAMLDYSKLVAPFNGRVLERRVDAGNLASPGLPLLVLEEEGQLRAEAAVEETRVGAIRLGDKAIVQLDAVAAPFEGRVSEVVPSVDVAARAFLVKVDLSGDTSTLRPGMFARVLFRVGTKSRLVTPKASLTSFGALDRVFVLSGDRARLRMITTGESVGPWTEVLSGLMDGEQIVLSPPSSLRDGTRIALIP